MNRTPKSNERPRLTRRRFLCNLSLMALTSPLWPFPAHAFGPRSKFSLPTLLYPGAGHERRGAQSRLAWELLRRTSIEANLDSPEITLEDENLFYFPVLYMNGNSDFPPFPEAHILKLHRFLRLGGFLFIDDFGENDAFDTAIRRELKRVFPKNPLERIERDHTLFKSFYLIDGRPGRRERLPYVEGIHIDERTPVVYSRNDLGGAWMRDQFGNWSLPVTPGGDHQRELAFRFGVNVIMYALCTNYKSDQVHIPFILKRRRSPFLGTPSGVEEE